MFNAARSLFHSATLGEPLPRVAALEKLYQVGTTLRKGEFIMIAGEPGTQKSGFALWLTQEMNLPTLYISADMNSFQASMRIAANATGVPIKQIEEDRRNGNMDPYLHALEQSNTVFAFDSEPTLGDIEQQLEAYVEVYDAWPEVMVVDNLMDVYAEAENENQALKQVCAWGHQWVRESGCTLIYLHHMTEGGDPKHNSAYPRRRKDILQKVAAKPELILSVSLDGDEFRIATVKQRMGPSDASGGAYVTLRIAPEYGTFSRWSYVNTYARDYTSA